MANFNIVHYLNQFFAGAGGEEKADLPPEIRDGPLGPGRALERFLPAGGRLTATVFCGDNYISEKKEQAVARIVEMVRPHNPRLLIAGPAFDAGRYGVACAEVCQAASRELGIQCISAMYPENPGVDIYRGYKNLNVYVLPGGESASRMQQELEAIGTFAAKLLSGQEIGPAAREGYLPRGIRPVVMAQKTGVERAIDMLLAKVAGQPFVTELPLRGLQPITPAAPLADVRQATIAMASTAGVVPWGNPDSFKRLRNTMWRKYSLTGLGSLDKGKWEAVHGGYSPIFVNENPNFGAPLDTMVAMEKEGLIGHFHPYLYSTPGVQASVNIMQQIGREMAEDMKAAGVNGVVMVAT